MAEDVSLDDLQRKQEAMTERMKALQDETDPDRLQEAAAELLAEAEELQRMATSFEEQQLDKHGAGRRGNTEVILTPGQRKRIEEQTGVAMESLYIKDDAGVTTQTMPTTDPRIVEHWALREANRRKIAQESDEALRAQLVEVFAAIEAASPGAAEKLAELRADPNFLQGMLDKK